MYSRRDLLREAAGGALAVVATSPSTWALTPGDPVGDPTPNPGTVDAPRVPRPADGQVALTFDDGPHRVVTDEVLRILHTWHVPGTFFVVGGSVRSLGDVVRRVAAEGHSVQNHSMSHPYLSRLPASAVARQLGGCNAAVRDAIGVVPTMFRPPYGATNATVAAVGRRLGLGQIRWNATPGLTMPTAQFGLDQIASHLDIARRNRVGATVLLHDGSGHQLQMLDLLPRLIARLLRDHWRFVLIG